jgi:hypothetical protein
MEAQLQRQCNEALHKRSLPVSFDKTEREAVHKAIELRLVEGM